MTRKYHKPVEPEIGSISSGTMRPEDLIPTFIDYIELYGQGKDRKRAREIEKNSSLDDYEETGGVQEDVNELFEVLDKIASRYHMYFGAQDGDGACYGFWPVEPEDGDYILQYEGPLYSHEVVYEKGAKGGPVFEKYQREELWQDTETSALSVSLGRLILARMKRQGFYSTVYEVNDHGNMTCYRLMSDGRLVTLWACV